jgi:predicted ATPase
VANQSKPLEQTHPETDLHALNRLIALTGGPGAGKTAVLTELGSRGYPCAPDSARAIIRERVSKGLEPRPPPREFAEQILSRDAKQYQRVADAVGPVFFDRGVVDALGMVNQLGPLSAAELQARLASYPYFRTAFCFPPWEEIYTTDAERDHTFAHAVAVHREVAAWYPRCGYDLVDVPRVTVQERCEFILQRVG